MFKCMKDKSLLRLLQQIMISWSGYFQKRAFDIVSVPIYPSNFIRLPEKCKACKFTALTYRLHKTDRVPGGDLD